MSTIFGNALVETADKLRRVNFLVVESKFVDAKLELEKLSATIEKYPNSIEAGEYYYLLASIEYDTKPHLEVLNLAQKAYSIVNNTAENLIIGRIQELIGKLHVALGDLRTGEDYIRDAISSFRRVGADAELIGCYNRLAQVHFIRGEFKAADKFLAQAIELQEKDPAASESYLHKLLGNRARIQILLGKWEEAQAALESCLEYSQNTAAGPSEARNLLSLGYVNYLRENYSEARRLLDMANEVIKKLDLFRERAIFHEYMGELLLTMGDFKFARQHFNYALEIGHRVAPQSAIISQSERRLAELEFKYGNYALALEHANRALEVAEHVGEVIESAGARQIIAALAMIDGKESEALPLFESSIGIFESSGELRELAHGYFIAGQSLVKFSTNAKLAQRFLTSALKLAEQLNIKKLNTDCHFQLCALNVAMGNFDDAMYDLDRCETLAANLNDDRSIEECRILRLAIEDQMVDTGLSNQNQYIFFSSFLTASEYGNLKTGNLESTLKILRDRVKGDRAFILSYDSVHHAFEALASLDFEKTLLSKISRSLANGRYGSLPMDKPLLVSAMNGERKRTFDFLMVGSEPINGFIAIPIQLSNEVSGIVYVDRVGVSQKPFTKQNLDFAIAFSDILALKSSEEQKNLLTRDNQRLKDQLQKQLAFPNLITSNPLLLDILDRVTQVKDSPISILIEGETGTGKDLLAKAIHYNSNRKDRRFVSVNCAALPETLLESELFGYKRGAFTGADGEKVGLFEEADGGTFFLDEIGDMPLSIQVKLLRVIEEKEVVRLGETSPRKVDVRVVSATNRDLKSCMEQGQFRQDLYYRLSTFAFRLPPLRDRREDIPLLIKFFVDKSDPEVTIEPEAFNLLAEYPWPGNIRELENELKKLVLLAGSKKVISSYMISSRIIEVTKASSTIPAVSGHFSLYEHIAHLERDYILGALRKANWVKRYAADALQIPESTLRLKMKQYHISQE